MKRRGMAPASKDPWRLQVTAAGVETRGGWGARGEEEKRERATLGRDSKQHTVRLREM
jgi:hypothetical protein